MTAAIPLRAILRAWTASAQLAWPWFALVGSSTTFLVGLTASYLLPTEPRKDNRAGAPLLRPGSTP